MLYQKKVARDINIGLIVAMNMTVTITLLFAVRNVNMEGEERIQQLNVTNKTKQDD
jgi:hypothetical protein